MEKLSTPVTAKIRILEDMEKTLKIAHLIEDAGADALTVHGRTRQQQYSGEADHSYVKRIKQELSIPVIANGDIIDEISARQVLDYTECDGIMIGRAAMAILSFSGEFLTSLRPGKCWNIKNAARGSLIFGSISGF